VPAPERILAAVTKLSQESGERFEVSEDVVPGTRLYVVFARDHELPDRYIRDRVVVGFRVPENYPDANPEDSFFIVPSDIKLKVPDSIRNSRDLNRSGESGVDYLAGTALDGQKALVFSWHIWDRRAWSRTKHSLTDHYRHALRRFEQPEHD
jgi:hypothetical protein